MLVSLLDNDLYKFTMMQTIWHRFRDAQVEYTFILRRDHVDLRFLATRLKEEIQSWSSLSWQSGELAFLAEQSYFKKDFLDFLSGYSFNTDLIDIREDDELSITIRGAWVDTILFEIPLLMRISALYHEATVPGQDFVEARVRLARKIELLQSSPFANDFRFVDFGTRRRYSHAWQQEVLQTLIHALPTQLVGTSNLYFAKTLGLKPVGTMAHEFIQAAQVLGPSLRESQRFAWQVWLDEYGSELSVALTDTLGLQGFLRDFTSPFAEAFRAVRQDSGDPSHWAEIIIAHYESLGIDPKTKSIVFSDGLTMVSALDLFEKFHDKIGVSFGIGTHLMNDTGAEPLSIVIKLSEVNGKPVAKLSDTPEKIFCKDPDFLRRLIDSVE